MAKTLEQLLKEKGYTEEELKALEPMLTSPKFRSALESEISSLGSKVDELTTKLTGDQDWYNNVYVGEYLPTLEKTQREVAEAKARAAAAEEKLKTLNAYGIDASASNTGKTPEQIKAEADAAKAAADKGTQVDTSNFVTRQDFIQTTDVVADAFTYAQDMAMEHMALFGSPLRNMSELRARAKAESRPGRPVTVQQIWEREFKVPEKRAELVAAEQKAHDDKIAADAIANFQSTQRNPMTRPVGNSVNPFQGAPANDAKPWLKSDAEKRSVRLAVMTGRKTA